MTTLNFTALNEAAINSKNLNTTAVNEAALHAKNLNTLILNEAAIHTKSFNTAELNEAAIHIKSLNTTALNEATINSKSLDVEVLNQAAHSANSLDTKALNDAAIHAQTLQIARLNDAVEKYMTAGRCTKTGFCIAAFNIAVGGGVAIAAFIYGVRAYDATVAASHISILANQLALATICQTNTSGVSPLSRSSYSKIESPADS
jgi:hypothetical protein